MFMMIFSDLTNVSLRHINFITVAFLLVFTLLNGVKSISNNNSFSEVLVNLL